MFYCYLVTGLFFLVEFSLKNNKVEAIHYMIRNIPLIENGYWYSSYNIRGAFLCPF